MTCVWCNPLTSLSGAEYSAIGDRKALGRRAGMVQTTPVFLCGWGDMYEFSSRPFLATGDPSSGAVPTPGDTDSELGPARIIDELEATIARFDRLVANRSSEELSQA